MKALQVNKPLRFEIGRSEGSQSDFNLVLIMEGHFDFLPMMQVSERSVYRDSVWSWENPSNLRLKLYTRNSLTIDWNYLLSELKLTSEIIADLKKYAFFRYKNSAAVFSKTKKNAHPSLVVAEVKAMAEFLSLLRRHLSVGEGSLINTLDDIEVQDIRDVLDFHLSRKKHLKNALRNLGSPIFGKYLNVGRLKWNQHDIETLQWHKQKNKGHGRLPDDLFLHLSNSATEDVRQFLMALDIEVQDKSPILEKLNKFNENFSNFSCIFKDYVEYRRRQTRSRETGHDYDRLLRMMHGKTHKLNALYKRARLAAQIIIMMYTGARISELLTFEVGCLERKEDGWVIKGTVIKRRDLDAPTGQDEWVAIPIVRDAVRVLEETASVVDSKFLFHHSRLLGKSGLPSGRSNIHNRVKDYVKLIDTEGKWTKINVYPQQFRNSLVFEMRRAGLGLPFISFQLKHAFDALGRTVSNTTLMYGSLGSGAVQKAFEDASLIAMREVFHPDSPIAGGGAEELRHRRKEYFSGMVIQGINADRILQHLVKKGGLSLIDVGLGYCQGRPKVLIDGVESDPLCIGQLRCNPVHCPNAVIPEHKLPLWKTVAAENQSRADDPELAHFRESNLEAAAEANSVVRFFQIEKREGKRNA